MGNVLVMDATQRIGPDGPKPAPPATPREGTNPSRRGPLLAEARKAVGVSRRDVSWWSGVPFTELKKYESGERTPSPSVVRRISAAIVTASAARTTAALEGVTA